MYILILLQIINSIFLVKNPDKLFTIGDKEPYIITADQVTLDETGNGRVSHLVGNIKITQGKTIITGDEGYAYENEQMAEIMGNVKIDDEGTIITSENAKYFKEQRMAVLVDTVRLRDGKQSLKADSLIYLKGEKVSKAWRDVVLIDEEQNTEVKGGYGEYDFINEKGFMTDNPVLTLTEKDRKVIITGDTLRIKRKENFMSCKGNVRVSEDSITAQAGYLEYYSDSERIYLEEKPVIRQEGTSTLTGTTVKVFLENREIVKTIAINSAKGDYSFSGGATNAVTGDTITIFFNDGKTERIVVVGNAKGFYKKPKEGKKKVE